MCNDTEDEKKEEKMKGIICYYSGSGNTKLACQYIVKNIKNIEIDLFNIIKDGIPDLEKYDVVGFATFADFWSIPYYFCSFIEKIDSQNNKPAFVFNTYGAISGKTLKNFAKLIAAKGFNVIAGHSLHTPESFPPIIVKGWGNEKAPKEKEMKNFNNFISELDHIIKYIKEGKVIKKAKLSIGLLNNIFPTRSRTQARKEMGEKYVDESLCIECGTCKESCPYAAIELNPKPVFDMDKCYGCWACYNHCPQKAIYTKKFKGVGHYPKPNKQLTEKLKGKKSEI